MFNVDTYQSASQQRPTGSYFNYNVNPLLIENLPTASNSTINVINVNSDIYGSKILPYSFNISSSQVNIIDDGNGNLYGLLKTGWDDYISGSYISASYFETGSNTSSSIHVGNIFYAHGIAILTNQSGLYQNILYTSSSISFQNEHIIYENEVRCLVQESDYNLSYNPTLLSGSYISGSVLDFATVSDFQPYATSLGLYNDNNELLAVAKFGKPIMISPDTDMTFVVKYDE
jgi:hypothetical protein